MGKATKFKREELAQAESAFQQNFVAQTRKVKEKLSAPIPDVSEDFKEYEGFFVRDKESFTLKTKSKDRDKQRYEFVRHVFNVYPVPAFMFNAWETPPRRQAYHRYDFTVPYRNMEGFATKEDYRLWYICMATGGSFYKEYGSCIFTKKECHTFLNCKHDLTIAEAVVYAIAYAGCSNIGKALRISKTKLNGFNLTIEFWREVIRFFARQECKSKEQLDDIVDYIVSQRQENPQFTIIGKGHTIESLTKKVETWHQDLRRLKVIGEAYWEGINIKDSSYNYKDAHGNINEWTFTQIKSAKDLQNEGNAMRHCVLSYKDRCISGFVSIWSVKMNGNRKLTIELNGGSIVQVRGLANRVARSDEKNIVLRWAKDNRLWYK
jgi:hypothetical protein